jgi:hypothetical protein
MWYSLPAYLVQLAVSHFSLDKCFHSLLFQSWFCSRCGFELCGSCYNACATLNKEPPMPCVDNHCKTWLSPVAVFPTEVLQDQISAMETALALPPPKGLDPHAYMQPIIPEADRHAESYTQSMSKYKVGELTENLFLEKWSTREPFILTGIIDSTNPDDLLDLKKNKGKHCTTTFYDGQAWQTTGSTLGSYFKTWKEDQLSNRSLQIRVCSIFVPFSGLTSVQDYPPKGDLKKVHPKLHDIFMRCVAKMFQAHISPHGPLNLFSYFLKGSLIPDLGMYSFAILGCIC